MSRFSGSLKSAFARGTIMKAAGAVTASLGVGFFLNKFGARLPFASNRYGRMAYYVGIPILAAFAVNKVTKGKHRDFAEGLVIGGLVLGINAAITAAKSGGSMANYTGPANRVNQLGLAGELGATRSMGFYPTVAGDLGTNMSTGAAFQHSAW